MYDPDTNQITSFIASYILVCLYSYTCYAHKEGWFEHWFYTQTALMIGV